MKYTIRAAIAAAGLAALPAAVLAAAPLSIRLGDVPVTGMIPDGYCLPVGINRRNADQLAKGDPDNQTHAMLIRCDQQDQAIPIKWDYYLVKSPNAPAPAMTRAEFIAMMAEELNLPAYQGGEAAKEPIGKAGDNLSAALGTKVDLSGEIKARGADAVCIYMGGQLDVRSDAASYPIALGAAAPSSRARSCSSMFTTTPPSPTAAPSCCNGHGGLPNG
ncbi:hypothetical protein [Sphingopyxis panaciterrae]